MFCISFAVCSLCILGFVAAISSQNTDSDSSSSSSSSLVLCIGVLSSTVGSLQTASGYCAQRLSHQVEESFDSNVIRGPVYQATTSLRRVGIVLLVCGTMMAVLNLGILEQSVTAPFAAMTLIFNGGLASAVLHEAITRFDIIATVLVLVGVGIAMLGVGLGKVELQSFELQDIENIFTNSWFPAIYSIVVLGSLLLVFLFVTRYHLETKPIGLCLFSIGGGVISGFSSVCTKCAVEVLKGATQHHSDSDLSNPVLYLFVLGIPICVLSQLKLMTMGLQYFGTLQFVPPYHAFIILSNLVNGMVYFDEAKGYTALSASLFIIGCGVAIGGVGVLVMKAPTEAQLQDEKLQGDSSGRNVRIYTGLVSLNQSSVV